MGGGGRLTVWTGTQRPFGVRSELAEALDVPEAQVRVIVPDTGAGYGGKHTGEAAIEAARLARASGRPVRVMWSREEELTWAYFRPAAVIDVRSGAGADGALTAWEFTNINSGAAGILCPYEIPNQRIDFRPADSPLRQGSYRALAATANHFARESHLDELAQRSAPTRWSCGSDISRTIGSRTSSWQRPSGRAGNGGRAIAATVSASPEESRRMRAWPRASRCAWTPTVGWRSCGS